jgi:hypothetical protein
VLLKVLPVIKVMLLKTKAAISSTGLSYKLHFDTVLLSSLNLQANDNAK